MSDRSSNVMVGAFVVGAMIIITVGALFFAGGGLGGERRKAVMIFEGSLYGLTVGAPVALRGVTIGQVTDIDLILKRDTGEVTMAVEAEIDPSSMVLVGSASESITDELVHAGLRAQLNTQSLLTGLLYIQLDFFPNTEPDIKPFDSPHPQIPTIPTEFEQLREKLEEVDFGDIAENIDRIAQGMDNFLNSDDMQALPSTMRSALESLQETSETLNSMFGDNAERVARLLDEGGNTLETLNAELPQITGAIDGALLQLNGALSSADATLKSLEEASAPTSPTRRQLSQAMHELSLAARALRSLARSLEEHPEALLRGRQEESQ